MVWGMRRIPDRFLNTGRAVVSLLKPLMQSSDHLEIIRKESAQKPNDGMREVAIPKEGRVFVSITIYLSWLSSGNKRELKLTP